MGTGGKPLILQAIAAAARFYVNIVDIGRYGAGRFCVQK